MSLQRSATSSPLVVWVITEGLKGTENQCLGITEALEALLPMQTIIKRISLNQPWKLLSPYLGFECGYSFTPKLESPWPDLLIASGRKSIAASRYIKKQSGGKTLTIQIQDPRVSAQQFDLVIVPEHDPARGPNVYVTTATPNRISDKSLAEARAEFAPVFSGLQTPRVAVLIGGSTKRHQFTSQEALNLADRLSDLSSLMITTSRRTGSEETSILKDRLQKTGNYFWDGETANPYAGMLAWADVILVTADSTSMISEAATTGKPVYVIPMQGLTRRQQRLVENLKKYGAVRDFDGTAKGALETWTYPPLRDAEKAAKAIYDKLNGMKS